MGNISLLPESVFNKIAAGEVIERPSSVVKELIENSIDAKASLIKVSIENTGLKSISVHDNGCGMDPDDAILCFEPHATSKIRSAEDIFKISTMGFRGEAMPSIASVSRVRLKTKKHDAIEGCEVVINGGNFISQTPIGCASGTEISVSDLFFNVPARKKFLKGKITEEKHICETVLLLALANKKIAFELRVDGKVVFNSPSYDDLKPRLQLLLGKEIADNSMYFSAKKYDYQLSGYITKPSVTRNSRREQRFFVNNRPIRSICLSSAVREGYGTHIMHGTYPSVTLFLDIPISEVDVNVHPAKHEIKFRKEAVIASFISEAIRDVLNKSIEPLSSVSIAKLPFSSIIESSNISYKPQEKALEVALGLDFKTENKSLKSEYSSQNTIPNNELKLPGCGYLRILEILNKTYILALSDIGLVVIDQHAAHERIIFERLLKDYSELKIRQELLIPVTIELSKPELLILRKALNLFNSIGFGIEFFGENTVIIQSIPHAFKCDNISSLISNILNSIIEQNKSSAGLDQNLIAKTACSLAVKAKDDLSLLEAVKLVSDLSKCELPFNCPHGRPTVINISIKELEKRFGRIL